MKRYLRGDSDFIIADHRAKLFLVYIPEYTLVNHHKLLVSSFEKSFFTKKKIHQNFKMAALKVTVSVSFFFL